VGYEKEGSATKYRSQSVNCAFAPRGGPDSELIPITEHCTGTLSATNLPNQLSAVPSVGYPCDRQLLGKSVPRYGMPGPDPELSSTNDRYWEPRLRGFSRRLNTCRAFCSLISVPGKQKMVNFCRNSIPNGPILNSIGNSIQHAVEIFLHWVSSARVRS
jgi:hypothetical protein